MSAETRTADTRAIVNAYHEGWTAGRFDDAIRCLDPALTVEVPVNDYPDAAAFGAALRAFGSMVRRVELLTQLVSGDEAMLLYDMEVAVLGPLRVAEHFTVRDGRIVRLRQIHDTAALRASGMVGA